MNDQVLVTMKDLWTNEVCQRLICKTQIMDMRSDGFFLGDRESQRTNLLNWIEDRANAQHDTWLDLIDWEIV